MRVDIMRYQDVLPALQVEVAGTPRTFLLDTGAGLTCLAPALVAELGLVARGRLTGLRMGGERVDLPQVDPPALTVGGLGLAPLAMGVLDLAAFLPEGWPPVDGVLALDAFRVQPLTLDLRGRALWLETPDTLAQRVAGAQELTVRVSRPLAGVARELFVAATMADRTLWLELDSCNAAPVLLATHTGVEVDEDGDGAEAELDLGGTAPWRGAALVQDLIFDGNLGQTFLAEHVVTMDLEAERMWAVPSQA